jgi:hypothetical protein
MSSHFDKLKSLQRPFLLTCFLQVLSRGFAPIWKLTRKIRRSWHQADGWNSDTCDMTPLLFLTVTFRPLWTCQARAGTSLSAMRMEWESSWWGADVVKFTCGCTDVVFRLLSDGVDFFSAVRWNSRESLVSQELEWWTTSTRSNYWWMHANGTACDEPYPYCLFAFLFSDLPERFERGEDLWAIFVRVCSRKRLLTLVILRCLCYGIALKIWWQAA